MKKIFISLFAIVSFIGLLMQPKIHSQTINNTSLPDCTQCDVNNTLAWEYNDYLYEVGMHEMVVKVAECADYDLDHWSDIFDVLEGISPWGSWENADDCSRLAFTLADQLDTDHMERTLCAEEIRDRCYIRSGCYVDPEYFSDFPDEYCD